MRVSRQATHISKFALVSLLLYLVVSMAVQDNAPQITLLDFPREIKADGNPVSGFIFFKDPDGDVMRAEFTVVQAIDFQPFGLELQVKGVKEGVIEFRISTKTPQRVVLRAVLVDEAGNRSAPWEFSFEAIDPARAGAILQVSPTSLSFSSEVGRTPPSQIIQIINAGRGVLTWSATADQSWIILTPSSGTAPSTVTVSVNVAGLGAGSYSGQITVTALGAQGSPAMVTAILTVKAPIAVPFVTQPPRIDGQVGSSEWREAFQIKLKHGWLSLQLDSENLYMLLDVTDDTYYDPPTNPYPNIDFFRLVFDVDLNQQLTPNVDVMYSTSRTQICMVFLVGPGMNTTCQNTASRLGSGFTVSPQNNRPHRIWELAIKLMEIRVRHGGQIRFGVKTFSATPPFDVDEPEGFDSSGADYSRMFEVILREP